MREALKHFLELPNVYEEITDFIKAEMAQNNNNLYTSLCQGRKWKHISVNFSSKIVIPLFLYYDDFEINDALSPTAGLHKIDGLYYRIAT